MGDLLLAHPGPVNERLQKVSPHAHVAAGHEVVQYSHMGKKLNALEGAAHTEASPAVYGYFADITAYKLYATFLRLIKTGKAVHQAGFAGAVRADNGQNFVLFDMKGDILQNLYAPEGQMNIAGCQGGGAICT